MVKVVRIVRRVSSAIVWLSWGSLDSGSSCAERSSRILDTEAATVAYVRGDGSLSLYVYQTAFTVQKGFPMFLASLGRGALFRIISSLASPTTWKERGAAVPGKEKKEKEKRKREQNEGKRRKEQKKKKGKKK